MEKIPEGEAEDVKPCIIAEDRVGRSEGRAVEKSQNHGPLRGDGRSVRHAEEDRPPEDAQADDPGGEKVGVLGVEDPKVPPNHNKVDPQKGGEEEKPRKKEGNPCEEADQKD